MAEKQKQLAISDEANYRKLSEPAPVDELNGRVQAFWKEFYELRNKHRIQDIHVVMRCTSIDDDGNEGHVMLNMHAGSNANAESMLAWAFGRAQRERQEAIATLLADCIKQPQSRK